MKVRKFSELADRVRADPERAARVDSYKRALLRELSLGELRAARRRTQAELAKKLKTTQPGVSRLEHQADLYVSTLRSYVEALGGKLEIHGVFPDARIPIATFRSLGDRHESSPVRAGLHDA